MKNRGLAYVRVYDQDQLLSSSGDKKLLLRPFQADSALEWVNDAVFDISAIISESGQVYGHIELGLYTEALQQRLSSATLKTSSLALLEILLSALFSFMLGSWLVRQLEVLRYASSEIAQGKLGVQIPVLGSDEIAETAIHFNQMSTELLRASDALNFLNRSLEDKVVARTQDLKQSNDQLSSIMENMGDALFVLASNGEVIVSNPAAEIIFSNSIGKQFISFFPDELTATLENLLSTAQLCSDTLFFSDAAQEKVVLELTLTPLPVVDDHRHTLVLARDITQQHDMEEKEQMLAFQSGVTEISVSMMHNIGNILAGANGKLLRIKKAGTSLERMSVFIKQLSTQIETFSTEKRFSTLQRVGEMLSNVIASEITKPVNEVEQKTYDIANIVTQQERSTSTIHQLSRIHPRSFIKEALTSHQKILKRQSIVVEIDVESGLSEIYFQRNQLLIMLEALLLNSIEAISAHNQPEGEVLISFKRQQRHKKSGFNMLIEDNGIGIAEVHINMLFTPGYSTKPEHRGSGLHASGNFIHSIGGTIKINSEGISHGAVVDIWLPNLKPVSAS
jgi:PAS domain S-box-containing protein